MMKIQEEENLKERSYGRQLAYLEHKILVRILISKKEKKY